MCACAPPSLLASSSSGGRAVSCGALLARCLHPGRVGCGALLALMCRPCSASWAIGCSSGARGTCCPCARTVCSQTVSRALVKHCHCAHSYENTYKLHTKTHEHNMNMLSYICICVCSFYEVSPKSAYVLCKFRCVVEVTCELQTCGSCCRTPRKKRLGRMWSR